MPKKRQCKIEKTDLPKLPRFVWGESEATYFPPPRFSLEELPHHDSWQTAEPSPFVEHPQLLNRVEGYLFLLAQHAYHLSQNRYSREYLNEWEGYHPEGEAQLLRKTAEIFDAPDAAENRKLDLLRASRQRLIEGESSLAASSVGLLAMLGIRAADLLEALAEACPELVAQVAREYPFWPVRLGLTKPDRTGAQSVTRGDTVRKHLKAITLNSAGTYPPVSPLEGTSSPFGCAARQLYRALFSLRGALIRAREELADLQLSAWEKALVDLAMPMTKENCGQWWKVGKVFVDECWRAHPEDFDLLVIKLGLTKKTAGRRRARVIDGDLKDAFVGLANCL